MKRKIRINAWGNWYGYEGAKRVIEFGTDERAANEWLVNPEKYLSEKKELTLWLTRKIKPIAK
jgi:hypothetical protein